MILVVTEMMGQYMVQLTVMMFLNRIVMVAQTISLQIMIIMLEKMMAHVFTIPTL
jgi:hypothetical protein